MTSRASTIGAAAGIGGATLLLALFVHGAIPFVAVPTLGQALWTTGFSQSFVNDGAFSIYAMNFGAPQPAAISFGLAGAWPAALLIAAGLHPADAYSAMAAFWLSIAFVSAYRLARMLGVAALPSIAAAGLWLSMPMVWAHAEYSMLSLGIALLPFYFSCALILLRRERRFPLPAIGHALLYLFACLVSVFMDGYSFVLFVAGSSLLGAWLFARLPSARPRLLGWALPVHAVGVGLACMLYVAYVGTARYETASPDVFRAWGLDLAFLVVPSQGVHWLADVLGLSTPRSEETFFGDASLWRSTFQLPVLLAGVWAWWRTRRRGALASGLLLALLASLYMALGPSLKVQATKPGDEDLGQSMPARYAVMPTGSGWLSAHVPGLRDMRAAYRWLALAVFSGWLLLVLLLASDKRQDRVAAAVLALGLALFNLPDLARKWEDDVRNRQKFARIDAELVTDLRKVVEPRETVAFLPYRNDFLVNYLAARLDIVTYNIGGDKNLSLARRHWPRTLREFRMGSLDEAFPGHVILMLARAEADSVVLPYIDMRSAAHSWPPAREFKPALQPVVATLKASGFVEVIERHDYALVRLNQASIRLAGMHELESAVLREFCMPPLCLRQNRFSSAVHRMAAGRYRLAVFGQGAPAGAAWVEVVSGQAGVSAKFPLSGGHAQHRGTRKVLLDALVTLEVPAEDLQVRAFVEKEDAMRLDGYELVPMGAAAR